MFSVGINRHYVLRHHCQFPFQSLIEMIFSLVTHLVLEFLTSSIFLLVLLSLISPQNSTVILSTCFANLPCRIRKNPNYLTENLSLLYSVLPDPFFLHATLCHLVTVLCHLDFSHVLLINKIVFLCRGKNPNSNYYK